MFHMEFIWSAYAQFIQTQLDEVHLPESKAYISQGYCVTESALAQRNYEDELGKVMSRTNQELEEYFLYIISSQQFSL